MSNHQEGCTLGYNGSCQSDKEDDHHGEHLEGFVSVLEEVVIFPFRHRHFPLGGRPEQVPAGLAKGHWSLSRKTAIFIMVSPNWLPHWQFSPTRMGVRHPVAGDLLESLVKA